LQASAGAHERERERELSMRQSPCCLLDLCVLLPVRVKTWNSRRRTARSRKRKMTLLEASTGTLLFNYKEIVHTSLLEEYVVSKKWVIVMNKRQDKTAVSTQAETSKLSAQDRYCARGSGGGAKKLRENGDE